VALYLAEKVKNGTPRHREIAEKIPKRHPPFPFNSYCFFEIGVAVRLE
jgi:hypothetical protein